jgi:hypothetical protein
MSRIRFDENWQGEFVAVMSVKAHRAYRQVLPSPHRPFSAGLQKPFTRENSVTFTLYVSNNFSKLSDVGVKSPWAAWVRISLGQLPEIFVVCCWVDQPFWCLNGCQSRIGESAWEQRPPISWFCHLILQLTRVDFGVSVESLTQNCAKFLMKCRWKLISLNLVNNYVVLVE